MEKLLYVILVLLAGINLHAQITFPELFNRAQQNSKELIALHASREYLQLETSKIKLENSAPKTYLSSEVLFAPYFNNNGKLISTDPQTSAIGYDIGITNGGLYSLLLNTEMPILNHKQVQNLTDQNNIGILRTDNKIKSILIELKHSLAIQYLDALKSQAEYNSQLDKLKLLQQEINLVKTLTEHGVYRFIDYKLMQTSYIRDSIKLEDSWTMYQLELNQLKTSCGIEDNTCIELATFEPEFNTTQADTSVFLQNYTLDSIAATTQEKVFKNQYKPHLKLYANTGLNSTSIPYMGNHIGFSAGIQLSYTLFDHKQKQINHQQQTVIMDEANQERNITQLEIQKQKSNYYNAITSINNAINKEKKLQEEYDEILKMYNDELQKAEVSISEYLNFLQLFNQNRLDYEYHKIEKSRLIIEYNYWSN